MHLLAKVRYEACLGKALTQWVNRWVLGIGDWLLAIGYW